MVIDSIRRKALRSFAETGGARGLPGKLVDRLRHMLAYMAVMESVDELVVPPNFVANKLIGDRSGLWSLTVTKNWRMTFWINDEGGIEDLSGNYH